MLEGIPVVFYGVRKDVVIIGHPHSGIQRLNGVDLQAKLGDRFHFVLPRRVGSTPTSRFGWNWFTPLVVKYRKSLILVFVASLLTVMLQRQE